MYFDFGTAVLWPLCRHLFLHWFMVACVMGAGFIFIFPAFGLSCIQLLDSLLW